MTALDSLARPLPLFLIASALRVGLLLYGIHQDRTSALKYTDIDYYVFTDAARFLSQGASPYDRETYRYTPLLAYLLLPTTWGPQSIMFHSGKVLFALADLAAGWLIWTLLRHERGMSVERAGQYAALWLWNPMVATISTRGSSEGLLGVLTMVLLWAVERRRVGLAAIILGLGVHFKIYPFVYAVAIIWWMDDDHLGKPKMKKGAHPMEKVAHFLHKDRFRMAVISLAVFMEFNILFYLMYGQDFLQHTFFHHVSRLDHRHNFSPYNVLLYLNSASPPSGGLHFESLAFLPQLLLSCVLIPLAIAKKDLAICMMAQTFAFVTFNKVCTSQYFLWYMVFLPLWLPKSSLLKSPRLGIAALSLWVLGQAAWLQQGYGLEFLGQSAFFPGLFLSSLAFFLVNCWILGVIISDGSNSSAGNGSTKTRAK